MDCQVRFSPKSASELVEVLKALEIPAGVKTLIFFDPEAISLESLESIPDDFFEGLDAYFIPVNLIGGKKIGDVVMAVKREDVVAEPLVSPTS